MVNVRCPSACLETKVDTGISYTPFSDESWEKAVDAWGIPPGVPRQSIMIVSLHLNSLNVEVRNKIQIRALMKFTGNMHISPILW